jgi:hypothetical protein
MIETKTGDATAVSRTQTHGVIVAHIVNCKGAWGGGFVLALNKMSPVPKAAYMAWKQKSQGDIPMGDTQFVEDEPGKFIANMCAQKSVNKADGPCLIDYDALERCLKVTFLRALRLGYAVHMPAGMGSGLAGGDKAKILAIIEAMAKKAEQESKFAKLVKEHTGRPLELNITLWEFTDTTADSYVPPADATTADSTDLGEAAEEEELTAKPDDIASL